MSAPTSTAAGSCQLGPLMPSAPTTTVRGEEASSRGRTGVVLDLPPRQSAPSRRLSRSARRGSRANTSTGSRPSTSSRASDPAKCSAAASSSSADGARHDDLLVRGVHRGDRVGAGLGASSSSASSTAIDLDGPRPLHRLAEELVDRLEQAGVVPGVVVARRRWRRRGASGSWLIGDCSGPVRRRGRRRAPPAGRPVAAGVGSVPVDVLDRREELVQILEEIVAAALVVWPLDLLQLLLLVRWISSISATNWSVSLWSSFSARMRSSSEMASHAQASPALPSRGGGRCGRRRGPPPPDGAPASRAPCAAPR